MRLLKSKKGFNIGGFVGGLIGITIGIFVAMVLLPLISGQITASAGNFTSAENSLLGLVTLVLVIGIVVAALVFIGIKVFKK